MNPILFDTDVLIEHFRGNGRVRDSLRELILKKITLCCTPVNLAEIYHGIRPRERELVDRTMGLFDCLEITRAVGLKAGEYLAQFGKSHSLDVADALIAATAHEYGHALCTFNWKHYPMKDITRHVLER